MRCEADVENGMSVCQAPLRRDGSCPRESSHDPEPVYEFRCDLHEGLATSCEDVTDTKCNCGKAISICTDQIEWMRRRFTCPFHGDEY